MEFERSGDTLTTGGGGGFGSGFAVGSALNRDRDEGKTMLMAAIVIVIIFIFAILALALFNRDRKGHDYGVGGGDIAGILAATVAAKGIGCDGRGYDHDHYEIKDQIQHTEDRAIARQTQSELGAFGLMMQKTAADNEKDNLKEFGEVKQKLGMLELGMSTLLQERNNEAIVQSVVNRLMLGCKPCPV